MVLDNIFSMFSSFTIDLHYSQIPDLKIHQWVKIYLQHQNQRSPHSYGHSWAYTEQQKIWLPDIHIPSWSRRWCSAFLFQHSYCALSAAYAVSLFAFLFLILLFKMIPMCSAEVLSIVPNPKKVWHAYMCLHIHVLDKLHSGMNY